MPPTDQQFLTVAQVAETLQKTNDTIRRWIHERTLPATRIGGSWLIPKTALESIIDDGFRAIDCTTTEVENA